MTSSTLLYFALSIMYKNQQWFIIITGFSYFKITLMYVWDKNITNVTLKVKGLVINTNQ